MLESAQVIAESVHWLLSTLECGTVAKPGDWGWSVSLYQSVKHSCGGILIKAQYFLTAAHCFNEFFGDSTLDDSFGVKVFIGVHNRAALELCIQDFLT